MKGKKQDPSSAPPNETDLQLQPSAFHDDGKNLIVEVHVRNNSNRTLHAVGSPRNLKYDTASKTLRILLSDRESSSPIGSMFVIPRFVPVDPSGETVMTLTLPRFLTRIVPGANQVSPQFERMPIHEASSVQVEIDWSDSVFYTDPRSAKSTRQQIVDWSRATVRGRCDRREPPPAAP